MENMNSRTAKLDGIILLRHHMYRFNVYGFGVAQCSDIIYGILISNCMINRIEIYRVTH
jgi:hypothetical protein